MFVAHRNTSCWLQPLRAAAEVTLALAIATASVSWASDTFDADYLAIVSQAPGVPENSVYAGFENNESVSLYNGNLLISHPSSPAYPLDGGGSLQLIRSFNGKEARTELVHAGENWDPFRPTWEYLFHGKSWVGVGWTMHFGRVFRKAAPQIPVPEGYGGRLVYFEDSNGTEHMLSPFQISAHPQFRLVFVDEQTETRVVCSDPNMLPCGLGSDCCTGLASGGICDNCTCDCWEEDFLVDIAHYVLTYPDGTQYRLEKIVPEKTNLRNWIKNYDRAGWYTTEITDVHGSVVAKVDYYRGTNPKYPEAIKEVSVQRHGETGLVKVIETELWDTSGFKEGCLRELRALGADGQWQTYDFSYDEIAGGDLPLLSQVDLPLVTPNIRYEYDGTNILRVHYPHEGVSEYTYTSYTSGTRELPGPEALCWNGCDGWQTRMQWGVEKRTLYPDGLGVDKPRYTWHWHRHFQIDDCAEPLSAATNEFRMTSPTGIVTESKFDGHPCGKMRTNGFDGWETQRLVLAEPADLQADPPEPPVPPDPIRTELMTYGSPRTRNLDGPVAVEVMLKTKEVQFNDDANRTVTTFNHQRDEFNHWRLTRQTSSYLKTNDFRLSYTNYEDPLLQCRLDNHVLTAYDFAFVQQGGQRADSTFTFNCEGQMTEARGARDLRPVSGNCEQPSGGDWEAWDVTTCPPVSQPPGEVVHTRSYGGDATLDTIVYSGGDDYTDPALDHKTYTIDFTSSHGLVTTAKNRSLTYEARELIADEAGFITWSYDPNNHPTQFDYDALGRLTLTKSMGLEHPVRIIHDQLTSMKVIQSDGGETVFQAGNDNQIYNEVVYDKLGRVEMQKKAVPGYTELMVQVTRFDQMGRVIFESEWMKESDYIGAGTETWSDGVAGPDGPYFVEVPLKNGKPRGTVTFYGVPDSSDPDDPLAATPDPLGRVRRVQEIDGSVVEKSYFGPHEEVTVKDVGLAGGLVDVTTRYYYDALGQLVLADVPPLSDKPADPVVGADAVYDYDVNGNLIEVRLVDRLTANPFDAWKAGNITGGQVRSFAYDALGRLRVSTNPESGTSYFDAYDVWGNLLESRDALAQDRGYLFRNVYEVGGRLEEAQKVAGSASDRLSADGRFESGVGSWETGTVAGDSFQPTVPPGSSPWGVVSYASVSCISAPPGGGNNQTLKLGPDCGYSAIAQGAEAIRYPLTGVGRDDYLTFKYWRQVREGPGSLDRLSVYVVLGTGNDTSGRRVLISRDQDHLSYARWRQTHAFRLSDYFTDAEWDAGAGNLYLYFEFEKGDPSPTVGAGVAIDDVFVGRTAVELLAQYSYDTDACSGGDPSGACVEFDETQNSSNGQLTHESSYQSGRLVAAKTHAFRGLRGRLSGVEHLIDWAGVGETGSFVAYWKYNNFGLPWQWIAPYRPLIEQPREYETAYRRGLINKILVDDDSYLVGSPTGHAASFNPAGGLDSLSFVNGAKNTITQDDLYRPKRVDVTDAAAGTPWSSGDFTYDGAGNITKIGDQSFEYDEVGRLTEAVVLPQATRPLATDPYTVGYTYDTYGNMTDRTWAHTSETAPLTMGITSRNHVNNQITETDFRHDANGNLVRMIGATSGPTAMMWDSRNRMTAYYNGNPDAGLSHSLAERYVYDVSGYRIVRSPESSAGLPHIYIRDGGGQVLAEFAQSPTDDQPVLATDYIYGFGQLLAERRVVESVPVLTTNAVFSSGGSYGFAVDSDETYDSYMVDIRADSGYLNQIGAITPDANGVFWLAEAEFEPNTVNYIRIKGESTDAEPFSAPATMIVDTTIDGSSPNQIRTLSVSRLGRDVLVRWGLFQDDGQKTYLYFDRSDGGGLESLTKSGLPSSTTEFTLEDQAMASPYGTFIPQRQGVDGPSTCMPTAGNEQNMEFGEGCSEPEPDPPIGPDPYIFANAFHHRDHLGSLRVVTDAGGAKVTAHDYYPFGMEMADPTAGPPPGSRRRFTGHERDEQTGLDYMLARYCSASLGRFLTVDPLVGDPARVQRWNPYTYVVNNPVVANDPDGRCEGYATCMMVADIDRLASGEMSRESYEKAQYSRGLGAVGATLLVTPGGATGAGSGFLMNSLKQWVHLQLKKIGGSYVPGPASFDVQEATAATVGGLVTGGITGGTASKAGGEWASGLFRVAGSSFGATAGGATERALDGDPNTSVFDPESVVRDAAAGTAAGVAVEGLKVGLGSVRGSTNETVRQASQNADTISRLARPAVKFIVRKIPHPENKPKTGEK